MSICLFTGDRYTGTIVSVIDNCLTKFLEEWIMSSLLGLTAVLFFGYIAYVIGMQVASIVKAVRSEDVLDGYKKEKDGFAVVRENVAYANH